MALFDGHRRIAHGAGGVVKQNLLLLGRHQAKQRTGLGEIVGVFAVVPVVGGAFHRQRRFAKIGLFGPLAFAVGLVAQRAAVVAIDAHGAVAVKAVHRAARLVDRNLVVVHAQAVALGVAIGEQACLQHFVGREADAGHHLRRVEGGLLHFGKEVLRVAVQLHHADFDQRVVLVRPDFGQVERVVGHMGGFMLGHDLHKEGPLRVVAFLQALVQVALVAFAVFADQLLRLRIGQVLDALLRAEVELDPVALVLRIDEAEGVRAKAVHVAVAGGQAAVAHHDGDLVQRLGQRAPEVPVVFGAAQVGARVALDGMVQVRELERVAHEEHRRVVANQVPVAFFGVELEGKAANVTLGVGRAAFTRDGGEAGKHPGLLANVREQLGTGVAGDVVGDGEGAVSARTLGVHAPLGNDLAVKVRQLFKQPDILQQGRAARARRHGVLVVHHGRASDGGQSGANGFGTHGGISKKVIRGDRLALKRKRAVLCNRNKRPGAGRPYRQNKPPARVFIALCAIK